MTQVLALGAILVPTATALMVAYWHRKQMRQLEAYRRDPSLGLQPPPSAVWKFVAGQQNLLVGVVLPVIVLLAVFRLDFPVSRMTVLAIACCVVSIAMTLVLELIARLIMMTLRIVEAQQNQLGGIHEPLARPASLGASAASETTGGSHGA